MANPFAGGDWDYGKSASKASKDKHNNLHMKSSDKKKELAGRIATPKEMKKTGIHRVGKHEFIHRDNKSNDLHEHWKNGSQHIMEAKKLKVRDDN